MSSVSRAAEVGDILFVLGAPRSGTSLVSRLLLDYFDVGMGPEGHWIAPFARRAPTYGDLESDANVRRLIRDLLDVEMFQIVHEFYSARFGWPVRITEDMIFEALSSRSYPGVVHAALSCLAQQLRRTRVGSKEPAFARQLDTLESLFPQATYLTVVRDGRDVALSMMRQPWGQKSWYANARLWVDTYERIARFRERIAPSRMLTMSYEELLTRPEQTCREVEVFLNEPLTTERRFALVDEISKGARSGNFEKWKTRMTPRHHRQYESVAGAWLERYGYPRVAEGARSYAWEPALYGGFEFGRRAWRKIRWALGVLPPDAATPTDSEAEGS